MRDISHFDYGVEFCSFHRDVGEHPLMIGLDDVSAGVTDDLRDLREGPCLIRDRDAQPGEMPLAGHATQQDGRKQAWIDVAAACDESNALSGEALVMLL
jgi:hypothetical protein